MVTDARVVISGGAFRRRVSEIRLDTLVVVSLEERRNGSGDIFFTEPGPYPWRYPPMWRGGRRPAGFYAIDSVQHVFRIIQDARVAARGA